MRIIAYFVLYNCLSVLATLIFLQNVSIYDLIVHFNIIYMLHYVLRGIYTVSKKLRIFVSVRTLSNFC